jgi:phosphatidate cytidylyltransferase
VLLTRVLAALVFTPALLALVWLGGVSLQLACLVLAALCAWEFAALTLAADRAAIGGTWALAVVVAHTTVARNADLSAVLVPFVVIAVLSATLAKPQPLAGSINRAALIVLGALYGGGLITYLSRLRSLEHGLGLAMLAVLATWGSDTGAYFAGKAFGRHKLYPTISPAKTVEGALGGIVSAIVATFLVDRVFPTGLSSTELTLAGVIAAVAGGIGDLAESMIKRAVGAKDSSRLIPGHGGVLDRFDGVLFAAPALYAFVTFGR